MINDVRPLRRRSCAHPSQQDDRRRFARRSACQALVPGNRVRRCRFPDRPRERDPREPQAAPSIAPGCAPANTFFSMVTRLGLILVFSDRTPLHFLRPHNLIAATACGRPSVVTARLRIHEGAANAVKGRGRPAGQGRSAPPLIASPTHCRRASRLRAATS